MRFSRTFSSFAEWLNQDQRTSRYAKEIIKKHILYPRLTLNELRDIRILNYDISKKSFISLSNREITLRQKALEVINRMRNGESFKNSMNGVDISIRDAKRHLGKALFKKRGRVLARLSDNIQRPLHFYEKGELTEIITRNFRDASKVACYMNAVKKALTGDESNLQEFKGKFIIDAKGKKRYFETDLNKLQKISEQIENPEYFELYSWE